MCNACGFHCCALDCFSACGCDHCECEECWTDDEEFLDEEDDFSVNPVVNVGDELHTVLADALAKSRTVE